MIDEPIVLGIFPKEAEVVIKFNKVLKTPLVYKISKDTI